MPITFTNIQRAKDYSENVVVRLRTAMDALAREHPEASVVIVGSLARGEASPLSDLDYFAIYKGVRPPDDYLEEVRRIISAEGLRAPAKGGAFAEFVSTQELLESIGGQDESNKILTKRMLLLLESEWITSESTFQNIIDALIGKYIRDEITQHQLARFFLNDVIRYYRTICVDFEHKTVNGGKSWGDRNLKIMFSRKLLYFSGILAAAQTTQSDGAFKRAELRRLLRLCPIDRIWDVCGEQAHRVLAQYDQFLSWMSDEDTRELLRKTTGVRADHTPRFREMKNAGHHFSWTLESLLHQRYAPTQPIFQALIL